MPTDQTPPITFRTLQTGQDFTPFRTLNEEWITRLFTLEPHDIDVLTHPETEILAKGGQIYFAESAGNTVGCAALIPMLDPQAIPTGVYELSKMAISPTLRGQGIGRLLLTHTIAQARTLGARSLFLGSSTKLPNAVHLYESLGFTHVPPAAIPNLPYTRADVFMTLPL